MARYYNSDILKTSDGKPYYRGKQYPNIPLSADDIYVITTIGDRLDLLAYTYYKDTALWWVISMANNNITNVNTNRVNSFTLITAPNGTGATIAWSFQTNGGVAANVKWASNVSPTATTTTGRFDIFSFVYNGTNWYGFTGGQNYV